MSKMERHIEDMNTRINKGTYGICRVTGANIDPRWLALVPHATINIDFDKFIALRTSLGLPITSEIRAAGCVSDRSGNPAGGTPRNCSEERGPKGDAQIKLEL